jgi:hypothetical protein
VVKILIEDLLLNFVINLQSGDIYIFILISRLGRSTAHNISIMQQLQDNQCKLVILDIVLMMENSVSFREHADTNFIRYAPLLSILVPVLGSILGP